MEKPHVVALRKNFLSKFMKNAESSERKSCVFLDETWVFANGTVRRSWQDEDVRSVVVLFYCKYNNFREIHCLTCQK
jgi:hypothetical protein